jgi:toluene monooxygenase system protein E
VKDPSLKTYSHLAQAQRMPNEYELTTTSLLYYPGRGFEVQVPLSGWYERYQSGSAFRGAQWERFRDPRETTYARYTSLQRAREQHVDGLLRSIDSGAYDRELPRPAVDLFERAVAPLRFAFHGLQMAAAYVGQMAPSGRITVACAFQAADEMRRIQRVAYRLAQMRRAWPGLGERSRQLWQDEPGFQPLRRLVEKLLVAWDWGEAFAALCLCAKPLLDALWMRELPALLRARGDYLWGEICFSLFEDCLWHHQWAKALAQSATEDRPENGTALTGWIAEWTPGAVEAARAYAALLGPDGAGAAERSSPGVRA